MLENISNDAILKVDDIKDRIYIIRGKKVMLDKDLAMLYGVPTKRLNEGVKRNLKRFPNDFMFHLNVEESGLFLRSQIATSKKVGKGGTRTSPYVFTEQGIAMLSSVLNSEKAIYINIQIIRIFTKLREMIEEMEKNHETNFREIFRVIRLLIKEDNEPKRPIGFVANNND